MSASSYYPMHVDAHLDSGLSRWLWLVKWVLVIPHYIVLAFLWIAFFVLSIVAFFAILFSGHYPRSIFEFNVGVMRWTWRVAYYAYGALGTDKYPPFTLQEVPDYPTHLAVDYPEHLSRGLVLVKWWLLAIPHYIVTGVFLGGTYYAYTVVDAGVDNTVYYRNIGLIGVLVFFAGVVLLFTGRYPRSMFDFILGMNRWVLRVAAYVGLMTDQYPPFRFDGGPHDPVLVPSGGPAGGPAADPATGAVGDPAGDPAGGAGAAGAAGAAFVAGPGSGGGGATVEPRPTPGAPPESGGAPAPSAPAPPPPSAGPPPAGAPPGGTASGGPARVRWTGGRVVALVLGCLILLFSLGLGIGGGALAIADNALRDSSGFLMSHHQTLASPTNAITSPNIELNTGAPVTWVPEGLLGDAKVTARSAGSAPVFVGVARASDVAAYLAGVQHAVVTDLPWNGNSTSPTYRNVGGTATPAPPAAQGFWVAKASGPGTQSIRWPLKEGTWTVVVMNTDGSHGVFTDVAAGVTVPGLGWMIGVMLVVAALGVIISVALLLVAFRTPSGAREVRAP